MSGIKVWGRLSSSNVQKVIWTLEELGFDYEVEERGGKFGGLDDPAYLTMNPNGRIPTIRDGDLVLWESSAIVRYLTAKYAPGKLFPSDPTVRAIVNQWADWTLTTFQPAWIDVFWKSFRMRPERQDPLAIAAAKVEAGRCLTILDGRLSRSPYLGGSALTYADIFAGAGLFRWYSMDMERPDTPAVRAWYERLRERAAYQKAVMVDFTELRHTV